MLVFVLALLVGCGEDCSNNADDDGDGYTDSEDQDCYGDTSAGCCTECSLSEGLEACGSGCILQGDGCFKEQTCACDVE